MGNVHEDHHRLLRATALADTIERALRRLSLGFEPGVVNYDHVLRDDNEVLWCALTREARIGRPPSEKTKQLTRELLHRRWAAPDDQGTPRE